MSEWKWYAVCDNCNWKKYAPFASKFHANVYCCPDCGEEKFSLKKVRWNSDKVKIFNPFTWGKGFWETK